MTKSKSANLRQVRQRVLRSFLVLAVSAMVFGLAWTWANTATGEDPTPPLLRQALEFNGQLWHRLFSANREGPAVRRPPAGKPPRFNGPLGLEEALDVQAWRLEIDSPGRDSHAAPLSLTLADLKWLPRSKSTAQFKCIEGWSEDIAYSGIRFADFIKAYGIGTKSGRPPDPEYHPEDLYQFVGLETPDGEYYVSIDMQSMLHPQTILTDQMNDRPLSVPNGAPLRLIIPVKYGIKNLKRIGRIVFSDQRPPDYWAEQGYDWFAGL